MKDVIIRIVLSGNRDVWIYQNPNSQEEQLQYSPAMPMVVEIYRHHVLSGVCRWRGIIVHGFFRQQLLRIVDCFIFCCLCSLISRWQFWKAWMQLLLRFPQKKGVPALLLRCMSLSEWEMQMSEEHKFGSHSQLLLMGVVNEYSHRFQTNGIQMHARNTVQRLSVPAEKTLMRGDE